MGKVRTHKVKQLAKELISIVPEKVGADFQANKELVKAFITTNASKKLINKVAGYLTALSRQGAEQKEEGETLIEAEPDGES